MPTQKTLGELRASEYQALPIREEMRRNLIRKLRAGERLFPGVYGYDETVVPQLVNAILAGHNILLLGERGQAKTRIIRSLTSLLDEWIPVIEGSEVNDSPFDPISSDGKDRLAKDADKLPIAWVSREERYAEKLATPDVSTADLIGEIDPIRVAEGRYLADERTIHFGLIPRTNRGIFAINELPDLPEKVQVALFNVLEERDVQIKGYKVRLPLDVVVVATANPEDYTNRGRIITPLKDRYDALIRTHYPRERALEEQVIEGERHDLAVPGMAQKVPGFMRKIVAELTGQARRSPAIDQRSGVSVRVSIANYESMLANAERRAILCDESEIVPRISDLRALIASTMGKVELEYTGEETSEAEIIGELIQKAVHTVFNETFKPQELTEVVTAFNEGWGVEVSDEMPSAEYMQGVDQIKGLRAAVAKLLGKDDSPGLVACAIEFILEGLHLSNKLNKELKDGSVVYR
ncbi:MAG: sigma 54-interacting transcriptional regulator [Chrysiogenetes bacterium]|nr:sigma 54-interacting transcriptional regulator [Chrysiogenetes bacterium]